jgi:hypothetical protein
LDNPESIARSIGSECWQDIIIKAVEQMKPETDHPPAAA